VSDSGVEGASNSSGCSSGATNNVNIDSQSNSGGVISTPSSIHNSINEETLFTKPPPRDGMTAQVLCFGLNPQMNLNQTWLFCFRNIMKLRRFFV
jgi:hypothetical protein